MKYYKYIFTYNSDTLTLTHHPKSWADAGIKYVRHETYHGVFRSAIVDVEFPKEGKAFIENVLFTDGFNSNINIEIYEQNSTTLAYDNLFFSGIIDLSTFSNDINFCKVDLIDGSKEAKITSRDTVKYNLASLFTHEGESVNTFTGVNPPTEFTLPPIDLYRQARCSLNFDIDENITSNQTTDNYITFDEILKNDIANKVEILNVKLYDNDESITYNVDFKGSIFLNGLVSYLPSGSNIANITIILRLEYYTDGDVLLTSDVIETINIALTQTNDSEIFDNYEIEFEENYNGFLQNYYAKLDIETIYQFIGGATQIDHEIIYSTDNFYIIEESTSFSETTANGYLSDQAATKLIQLMTDETDLSHLLYSEILGRTDSEYGTYSSDGALGLQGIFNGFQIRNINKGVSLSFRELFKSLFVRNPIGMWYDRANDIFKIEEISQFYKKLDVLEIGEVSDLKIRIAEDKIFNQCLPGYAIKCEYEELNGVNEVNTAANYSVPIEKFKNDNNLYSDLRGDSVGIELARRAQKTSTDTKYDSDAFIVSFERDGIDFTPIIVDANSVDIPGIEKYYNLEYTPKRILINNSKILGGCLNFDRDKYIRFLSNQMDNDVNTKLSTEASYKSEKEAVLINSIYNAIWKPFYYDFSYPIDANLAQELNTDPHRLIQFTHAGTTYKGFLMETGGSNYRKDGNWLLIQANV